MILDPIVPPETKYPFKLKVEVEWPNTVEHDGETYHSLLILWMATNR